LKYWISHKDEAKKEGTLKKKIRGFEIEWWVKEETGKRG